MIIMHLKTTWSTMLVSNVMDQVVFCQNMVVWSGLEAIYCWFGCYFHKIGDLTELSIFVTLCISKLCLVSELVVKALWCLIKMHAVYWSVSLCISDWNVRNFHFCAQLVLKITFHTFVNIVANILDRLKRNALNGLLAPVTCDRMFSFVV